MAAWTRIQGHCRFLVLAVVFLVVPEGFSAWGSTSAAPQNAVDFSGNLSLAIPLEDADSGSVGHTSQRGSYLSVVYGKVNFVILDMDMNQVLYQASMGEPLYRAVEIFGNFILVQPEQTETMTRIDLFTGEKIDMEGFLKQRLTDDVFVLTRDGFVIDVAAWKPVFRKNLLPGRDVVSVGHTFFFPARDSLGNFSGYEAVSSTGEPLFRVDDDPSGRFQFPESEVWMRSFPLPLIRREGDKHFLDMLQEDGNTGRSFDLEQMGVGVAEVKSPSPLKVLDSMEGRYLISIMGMKAGAKGLKERTFTYCVTDSSGEITVLQKEGPLCFGKFTPGGRTVLLKRGVDSFLSVFDPDGGVRFTRSMEEWFSTDTDIRVLGDRNVLLHGAWNTFLKCSLENGESTGLYVFPEGFCLENRFHVFEDSVYVFSRSMPGIPCVTRGTNLFSFRAGRDSPGWFDMVMEPLDPNAGPVYETFDGTAVNVTFSHNYPKNLNERLQVLFPEGTASPKGGSGLEYVWNTPSLAGEDEMSLEVTATLGPLSRAFPVRIISPRDFLELTVTKRFEPKGSGRYLEYSLDWELKNNSPCDAEDLRWTLDLENMKCIRPGLPRSIQAGKTKTGSLEMDLVFPGMSAAQAPGGYTVVGRGTLTLQYSRGQAVVREFDSFLEIPPLYSFGLRLYDPELGKNVEIDNYVEGLKFFDEGGNDITASLSVSGRGTLNNVTGFAPGLPERPVKIKAAFAESEEWAELAFQDNTSPRDVHPWFWSGPAVTLTLGPNKTPVANFRILPQEPKWSAGTTLDGSPSRDTDGKIVLYTWSSNQLPEPFESTSPVFGHKFTPGGIIPVTLTVTDNKGATASVTKTMHASTPFTVKGEETGVQSVFEKTEKASYEITIHTGDREKSGTDAQVRVALYGPADKNGNLTGSGEATLNDSNSVTSADPFERGHTDVFTIPSLSSLDTVETLTLRHNNAGDSAGWFVEGITVKNLKNGKVWKFAAGRWLATDEPPDGKTYAEFTPLEKTYALGVLFGGKKRSLGFTEASDTVFILPDGAEAFCFTQLEGSRDLRVERDDVLVGTHIQTGRGLRNPETLEESDWGVCCDASLATSPVRFRVKSGSGGNGSEDGYVWVFPSNWIGCEKTARMAMVADSLIRELRRDKPGQNPYDIFRCGKNAREKLQAISPSLQVMGMIVIDYGISALSIFGGIEDVPLEVAKDAASEGYFNETLADLLPKLMSKTFLSVMFEMSEIFTSMLDAAEWATEFFTSSIYTAPSEAYKVDLLKHLASNDPNFTQSAELMVSAADFLEEALTAMQDNDPQACRTAMESMSRLVVGENPYSFNPEDHRVDYGPGVINRINNALFQYPLAMLLSFEMQNIQAWKEEGHAFFNDYFGVTPGLDKKKATRAAMSIYEPIIRDMSRMAGILAQVALLGQ